MNSIVTVVLDFEFFKAEVDKHCSLQINKIKGKDIKFDKYGEDEVPYVSEPRTKGLSMPRVNIFEQHGF